MSLSAGVSYRAAGQVHRGIEIATHTDVLWAPTRGQERDVIAHLATPAIDRTAASRSRLSPILGAATTAEAMVVRASPGMISWSSQNKLLAIAF
jgi:hypothetical protein